MNIGTIQDLLEQDNPKRTAKDLYRNTAGEIEARDAANLRGLDAGARKNRLHNTGGERTVFAENGGRQYSIGETTDGRMVAVVDNDILTTLNTVHWDHDAVDAARRAAKTALSAFKEGIGVHGTRMKVNRTTRREYTKSDYSDMLRRKNPVAFADKMRAASVIDDVVMAAVGWEIDGELKHTRDDFVDFSRGRTLLASGDNCYTAEVVVGITESGELVLYDLVDIAPGDFHIKESEPSTTDTTKKSIGDIQEGSDESSITHGRGAVKQYSISEPEEGGFATGWHDDDEAARAAQMEEDGTEERAAWTAVEPEKFTGTVKQHYDGTLRQAVNGLAKSLNVPGVAKRDFLKPIAEELGREYYGPYAAQVKQMERMDFDAAIQKTIAELWKVKRLADERIAETTPVAGESGTRLTQEDVAAMYPKLKDARKVVEKAIAKNILTKRDKEQIQRLLRHDIQPEHLVPGRDNV